MESRTISRLVGALALAGALVLSAGCGSSTTSSNAGATSTAPTVAKVTVTKAWARTSPASANTGAAYFSIVSPVDDRLVSVSVDATVAESAMLHQTTTDSGGMTMSPVDGVDLKAGVPFTLAPGSHHVMLMGLVKPLKAGDTFTLSITLQKSGTTSVAVPVQDNAP
jgi:periplasmic copper chaperone A